MPLSAANHSKMKLNSRCSSLIFLPSLRATALRLFLTQVSRHSKSWPNFPQKKNYYETGCNIYHGVYDTVNDAFKVAPSTIPRRIGWNALVSFNKIVDQLMKTYGCPTPNAMRQNMTMFLSPHNPQDLPNILFKWCANCQEITIIANIKYTKQQLLMNIIDLLTWCGLCQCNLED
jgi:hypothetical protein